VRFPVLALEFIVCPFALLSLASLISYSLFAPSVWFLSLITLIVGVIIAGEPVVIEKIELSADGNVIEAYYRILGTFPFEEQTAVASIEVSPAEVSAELVPLAAVKPHTR